MIDFSDLELKQVKDPSDGADEVDGLMFRKGTKWYYWDAEYDVHGPFTVKGKCKADLKKYLEWLNCET